MEKSVLLALFLLAFAPPTQAWEKIKNENTGYWIGKPFKRVNDPKCPYQMAVFIPPSPTTTILYLHGYRDTVRKIVEENEHYALKQNNAVIIVPQGPCDKKQWNWDQETLRGLPELVVEAEEEVEKQLTGWRKEGLILAAHSAGCSPARQVLQLIPEISQVILLDAFYAGYRDFVSWQGRSPGRKLWGVCTLRSAEKCRELEKVGKNENVAGIVAPHGTTHNGTVGYLSRLLRKEESARLAAAN